MMMGRRAVGYDVGGGGILLYIKHNIIYSRVFMRVDPIQTVVQSRYVQYVKCNYR